MPRAYYSMTLLIALGACKELPQEDIKVWINANQKNIIRFEDAEPRYIKLELNRSNSQKFGIAELKFIDAKDVDGRNKFLIYNAQNSEKGNYPSYFLKQASFFTITSPAN